MPLFTDVPAPRISARNPRAGSKSGCGCWWSQPPPIACEPKRKVAGPANDLDLIGGQGIDRNEVIFTQVRAPRSRSTPSSWILTRLDIEATDDRPALMRPAQNSIRYAGLLE